MKALKGVLKHYYFLATNDVVDKNNVEITKCQNNDQSLLWKNYIMHTHNVKKIMLLLDHGGSLSRQQFKIVKAFGNYVY